MDPITPVPQAPVPQAPASASFDGPVALLKFGWSTFTKHWRLFLGIILVPAALYAIGILCASSVPAIGGAGAIIGFICIIAAYVFFVAAMPATVQALHTVSLDAGAVVSVKAQYGYGFKVFWSMVLVLIIANFVNQGATLLLVIPGIFVMVSTLLYMYTFVIDGKRNFGALTESYSLVRGRWWGVFGRFIILALVGLAIYLVVLGLMFLTHLLPGVVASIIDIVIGIALFTFMWTFGNAYLYRLYITLKSTRTNQTPTSTFRGWLIAFLCIGAVLVPIAIVGILSSVVLVSLNAARMKGLEAQQRSNAAMTEIQRQIDAENLKMIQQGQTAVPPVQK